MKRPRWFGSARQSELDEEMRFHIEQHAERLMQQGVSREEATRRAHVEFGSVASFREECREAKGLRLLDDLRADLQFALRVLRRQPGLSATAVLFLAVAVGANTAFFAFVNAYSLRPLPIRGAGRHFDLRAATAQNERVFFFDQRQYEALTSQAESAGELYSIERLTLPLVEDRVRRVSVEVVSNNFFPLLVGTANPHSAVLSHAGWRRLFGGEAAVAGKRIRLGSNFFVIAGVAPEKFSGVDAVVPDVWLPQSLRPLAVASGAKSHLRVGGILHEGVSPEQSQAVLSAAAAALSEGLPAAERIASVRVEPRHVISDDDEANVVAVGLVAFPFALLLVVACANLASLYLAGAAARQKELAIRLAIGASRWRLVRQLMTEALLLATLGAVAASALAVASMRALEQYLFQLMTRFGMNVAPVDADWRIAGVSLCLAVVCALLFGLLPSLEATDHAGAKGSLLARSTRPSRMRRGLLAAQACASLVLLVLAGVLLENANRFDAMNPGFRMDGLYESGYEAGDLAGFAAKVERMQHVEGVAGVGRVPLRGIMNRTNATVDGKQARLFYNYTDERYLDMMGIALAAGRGFTPAEARNQLPVAIVSEATAERLWPGRSAIGQSLQLEGAAQLFQVVGVARDVVSSFFFMGLDPTLVYLPAAVGSAEIGSLLARMGGANGKAVAQLQQACLAAAPESYCEPIEMRDIASIQRLPVRMASQVAMALGAVSIVLSCVGLYGVVAFLVERRRKEAGIRLALGSSRLRVMAAMTASPLRGVVLGAAVGLPVCFAAAKFAEGMAVYLRLSDPAVFVAAPVLLLLVAAAAALVPARAAASVDPSEVLREE
ncbi:MAG: ABC transporter permease [Bryobacterales bacterium]|nr:ABC transporter permease [Bryobacterales bacterium]